MGAKITEGLFVPIRPDTLDALYTVLEREGYAGDSEGVARFLSDVAGGLLDDKGDGQPDTVKAAIDLARKHGPTVANIARVLLRSKGAA